MIGGRLSLAPDVMRLVSDYVSGRHLRGAVVEEVVAWPRAVRPFRVVEILLHSQTHRGIGEVLGQFIQREHSLVLVWRMLQLDQARNFVRFRP